MITPAPACVSLPNCLCHTPFGPVSPRNAGVGGCEPDCGAASPVGPGTPARLTAASGVPAGDGWTVTILVLPTIATPGVPRSLDACSAVIFRSTPLSTVVNR